MVFILPPTKKPTPAEYAVLVVFVAAAFIVLGTVELVLGFRAPPERHELALLLEHRGFWCLAIGVAIAAAFWLFRRFKDY